MNSARANHLYQNQQTLLAIHINPSMYVATSVDLLGLHKTIMFCVTLLPAIPTFYIGLETKYVKHIIYINTINKCKSN